MITRSNNKKTIEILTCSGLFLPNLKVFHIAFDEILSNFLLFITLKIIFRRSSYGYKDVEFFT